MTVKKLSYITINSLNPFYLIINKINRYIGESNGTIYLMLTPIDGIKDTIKKYEEVWKKIKDLIR